MWSRLVCGLWLAAQTWALEAARVDILLFNIFGVFWGVPAGWRPRAGTCQANARGSVDLPARSGPRWGEMGDSPGGLVKRRAWVLFHYVNLE